MINRRSLITGLCGLVAAPAIVRASSLMGTNSLLLPDHSILEGWPKPGTELAAGWRVEYCALRFDDPQNPLNHVQVWMAAKWGPDEIITVMPEESNQPLRLESKRSSLKLLST